MTWRVGVDTGGTFTDVCLYHEQTHEIVVGKISSTPDNPGSAVRDGVRRLVGESAGSGDAVREVSYFAHGTTVATNALLQGKGARTGLITTEGFRDLLELGRQRRPKLYDLTAVKPPPLVPRDLRLEVPERVNYRGEIEIALDPEAVREAARTLRDQGVTAVSVCLLYSYLNPAHELLVSQVLQEELPEAFISVSHEVLPEFREYERLSTVAMNAFLGPVMSGYLSRLRTGLAEDGLVITPKVTQSNGGVLPFPTAEQLPVRTVLSGPSTGVVGAARLAQQSGIDNVITFDMGGTSSDVSLVTDARPTAATGMELDGRPVRAPMLDINTVGAGGGSIAWLDDGGHLKVGPQSAGADPGPACYDRGSTRPTVTDANVVLGILNQEALLGGAMPIDADRSYAAVEALGGKLQMSVNDTAQGIISVVTANMARAIRVISVQRGYDPADYALVAFGGAGPLHSGRLARELGIPRTVIPQHPGALSALGMLMTDLRTDYTRSRLTPFDDAAVDVIAGMFAELTAEAEKWFAAEQLADDCRSVLRLLDLRYTGQNYELSVPVPTTAPDENWLAEVSERFHAAHEARYGYASRDQQIEAATYRVEAIGRVPAAGFPARDLGDQRPDAAQVGTRTVYLPETGRPTRCPLYGRQALRAGHRIVGPAVIEQYDTTVLILPGEVASIDRYLMIIIDRLPDADDPARGEDQ